MSDQNIVFVRTIRLSMLFQALQNDVTFCSTDYNASCYCSVHEILHTKHGNALQITRKLTVDPNDD